MNEEKVMVNKLDTIMCEPSSYHWQDVRQESSKKIEARHLILTGRLI